MQLYVPFEPPSDNIFKYSFIFVIRMLEIGSVLTLRSFHAVSFFGHLCHYVCPFVSHLEHFDDISFKIIIHIHNQSASNRLCAEFEIIPRSCDF